ncbi:TetR-like C-terminal domain-containing protein [Nonomuraea sp. NPDC049158]|uniref:TetR-like C-terminal domain-containing protein n=1 Tax=Nonomuraea sp. NPDC049158 TaxID=3155649 RepID=UPI0033E0AFD5
MSKATIYKHWSNRICVAIDAFALHMAEATPVPDTGSACEDLLRQRFLEGRRELIRQMWRRGVQRGELRTDVDVEVAQDVLFGSIIFRLVSGHAPLTPTEAEAIAKAALTGLLAQPASDTDRLR